jgi:hypothetical protein
LSFRWPQVRPLPDELELDVLLLEDGPLELLLPRLEFPLRPEPELEPELRLEPPPPELLRDDDEPELPRLEEPLLLLRLEPLLELPPPPCRPCAFAEKAITFALRNTAATTSAEL